MVVAALGVAAFGLGIVGYSQLPRGSAPSVPDRLYSALDLFRFATLAKGPYPVTLEVARWLAPLTIALAGLWAIGTIFSEQATRLRVRLFYRKHLIVCGLGQFGYRTALAFHDRGERVVVIERNPEGYLPSECRERDIPVLRGDATDALALRDAGLSGARYLVTVCGDDSVNAEVAVQARNVLNRHRGSRRVRCFVHVADESLCEMLERSTLEGGVERADVSFLNLYRTGPAALIDSFPQAFAEGEGASPHILVVADDHIGTTLVIEAARRWWLEHRGAPHRLRVTLVSLEADGQCQAIRARFPHVDEACHLTAWVTDATSDAAATLPPESSEWTDVAAFVSLTDETASLRATLRLQRQLPPGTLIVACTAGRASTTSLLDVLDRPMGNIEAFPLLDRVCQPEVILNSINERIARALHENYLRDRRLEGTLSPKMPTHRPWDELDDQTRESNRAQAAGYSERLQAVGHLVEYTEDWDPPLPKFTDVEIETMSEKEHDRWRGERQQAGWRYGPRRDDAKKLHPDLVSWDELSEPEREKDREAVRELPALLAAMGLVVVRRSS